MDEREFNAIENLVEIQYQLLNSKYSLKHHLETIKKLPKESRLHCCEKLYQEWRISEEQYNSLMQE